MQHSVQNTLLPSVAKAVQCGRCVSSGRVCTRVQQAKQYVQEIRVEQLARRISALEANDSAAAAAAARPGGAGAAVGGGSAADPTQVVEQIVDLLRGVDKLTKKVGAVEVQMKGGAGKFGGGKDRSGAGGGGWAPADIENRFRRLEVEQRESLREMERRVNAKMEVRAAPAAPPPPMFLPRAPPPVVPLLGCTPIAHIAHGCDPTSDCLVSNPRPTTAPTGSPGGQAGRHGEPDECAGGHRQRIQGRRHDSSENGGANETPIKELCSCNVLLVAYPASMSPSIQHG